MSGRPCLIPLTDLAFAYELRCEGYAWKFIELHTGYQRSTIIKSLRRRMQ